MRLLGRLGTRKPVVTPTDRPKSVRDRYVIGVFGGFLCFPLAFEFSVGKRFCHRTDSNLLFSLIRTHIKQSATQRSGRYSVVSVSRSSKLVRYLTFQDCIP